MRYFCLVILFLAGLKQGFAQDRVYGERKERHKVWKKWKSNRQSYNPYLDRKSKDKPSSKIARENKKHFKKQQRAAKKQMRRSRKDISKANKRRMKGN